MRALLARVTLGNREMTLNEQMQLADKFALVNNHAWRATHYVMIGTGDNSADDIGLVMVEQLSGRYQVCRVEPFSIDGAIDYQPKYYGEFTHNQLAKAFKLAATIAATPITTTTIEI